MRPTVRSQPGFATMIVEHPRHAVFSVSTSAWLHRLHVRVTAAAMRSVPVSSRSATPCPVETRPGTHVKGWVIMLDGSAIRGVSG